MAGRTVRWAAAQERESSHMPTSTSNETESCLGHIAAVHLSHGLPNPFKALVVVGEEAFFPYSISVVFGENNILRGESED